uniref:Uncharacterized protein n=1 Tax=Chromera velia CCMP2878 TaxID=1169474 RepID=A0A0K6S9P0_9ALVE|eukprot:Cvel_8353.t1-p1 / transcript=Cvel_8353.t1 / gene=Cvel_8353 / organism=Chromera_velia_CCMP2878 / gene_product=hypothetical protein / transcript_product=hypothetical protein / location=Cvel_scaffold460:13964-18755(-) / protein_length=876 / sequence_SO=supercontig / SO=protein_coding / is_pseudo=false
MSENKKVLSESPPPEENTGGDSSAQKNRDEEMRVNRKVDKGLSLLFQRAGLTSETVSQLGRERSSFGVAWLSASLYARSLESSFKRKIFLEQPCVIDISDGAVVKGEALPGFLKFLEGRPSNLKKFTFAKNSMGVDEARQVFPAVLPSLEGLCVKDTMLSNKGLRPLSTSIAEGRASSLLSLKLENVGLNLVGLNTLCEALKKKTLLQIETLSLSQNPCCIDRGTRLLSPVLNTDCLPGLRVLLMRSCGMTAPELKDMATILGKGDLPKLETLDFGGNPGGWSLYSEAEKVVALFGKALRVEVLPSLKNLNLVIDECHAYPEDEDVLLNALASADRPPLENVEILLQHLSIEKARSLGGGNYPSIRTLYLHFGLRPLLGAPLPGPEVLVSFLSELLKAQERPQFDALDLNAGCDQSSLMLMEELIRAGRFGCIRKLSLVGLFSQSSDSIFNPFIRLSSAFVETKLCRLSELILDRVQTGGMEILRFVGEAVRVGHLPGLRVLEVSRLMGDGGNEGEWERGESEEIGLGALMRGFVGSVKVPPLERLSLSFGGVGAGVGSVGSAFMSGKLGKLSDLRLDGGGLTNDGLKMLAQAVRGGWLVNLTYLRLPAMSEEDEGWREFMKAIGKSDEGLPRLKHFHPPLPQSLALALRKLPALEAPKDRPTTNTHGPPTPIPRSDMSLVLDEEGLSNMAEAVRAGDLPSGLKSLNISLCESISVDSLLVAIGESEKGLPPCVQGLDLRGGHFREETLAALAASEEKLSGLRHLELGGCDIDDSRLQRLGEVFNAHVCPGLASLWLEENKISLKGVSAFLKALHPESLPTLSTLRFYGQKTTEMQEANKRVFRDRCEDLVKEAKRQGKLTGLSLGGFGLHFFHDF